ncbi:hypothetical protein SAMN05443429_101406 [Cruoricaptor ignavus]|uniref:Uncharacterized protein n=1 Tax=Cruoricaptor ignavus TaxID=1118202 RepID=A0A1M6ASY6_9FLAO|nr:hypothetical protein SAMN05443429_101406 [Cruoricaptor ignavus]
MTVYEQGSFEPAARIVQLASHIEQKRLGSHINTKSRKLKGDETFFLFESKSRNMLKS